MIFTTAYSIPISAQLKTPTPSQLARQENPIASRTRQPVQAFSGQFAVFLGHQDRLTSAIFSPDGRQILPHDRAYRCVQTHICL